MGQLVITGGGVDREISSLGGINDPPVVGNVNGNNGHRILMKFADSDLAQVPAAATITSVSLAITEYDVFSNNAVTQWTIELRRVLVSWTSGATGASWAFRDNSGSFPAWSSGGASADDIDRASTVSASFLQHSNDVEGVRTYSSAGLAADVQYWIADPASRNLGWLIQAPQAEFAGSGYSYSELWGMTAPITSNKPVLTINYSSYNSTACSRLTQSW
jgi:hypothetical protein